MYHKSQNNCIRVSAKSNLKLRKSKNKYTATYFKTKKSQNLAKLSNLYDLYKVILFNTLILVLYAKYYDNF